MFLFAGKIYAYCIDHDEHCNYPNCTQTGVHYHHNLVASEETNEETTTPTYYHCEVEGCQNTTPHTHETPSTNCVNCGQRQNRNNNQYGHHSNGHHRNHH